MRHDAGVTLIEACIVLAVCAVVALSAAPGLQRLIERQALRGAAEALRSDLHYLRSASITRGRTLWLTTGNNGACYVMYGGERGGCSCGADGQAVCDGDSQVLKAVALGNDRGLVLHASSRTIGFEPTRGTVTPTATFTLLGRDGASVQEVLNLLGRVRLCSPGAALAGYVHC